MGGAARMGPNRDGARPVGIRSGVLIQWIELLDTNATRS